jgi:hypothetical protein
MKKTGLLIVGLLICTLAFSQNCNIGNQDTTGFDATNGNFQANFLVGIQFPLETVGVLNSLNLIGKNTGAQVQMALYDDDDGAPNNLIVFTGTTTVGSGVVSLPVSPTELSPGNYWVMAIYDDAAIHTYKTNEAEGNIVYYDTLIFGSPIPPDASSFLFYTGHDFTYFLDITCGPLGVNDLDMINSIEFYPNPSSEFIYISNEQGGNYQLEIIDAKGVLRKKVQVKSSDTQIDIRDLSKGAYHFVIDNRLSRTIVLE